MVVYRVGAHRVLRCGTIVLWLTHHGLTVPDAATTMYEPAPGRVIQAFSFALDATPEQEASIRRHFGARRYAYNWTVAEIRRELSLHSECGVSFGPPSLARLRKRWNRNKHRSAVDPDGNPWWQQVSKEAFSNGIADAVTAYWNWQRHRTDGARRVGFPRFRRKGRDTDRYRVSTGSFGLADRRHVRLPRIGRVRVHENTRRLHRLLGLDRARVLNVTVRRGGRRLLAIFQVEVVRPQSNMQPTEPESVVGVDAGVRRLATVANPKVSVIERVDNPRALDHNLAQLRGLHRARSRCVRGSVRVQAQDRGHISIERPDSQPARQRDTQADHQACQDPRHCGGRVAEREGHAGTEEHARSPQAQTGSGGRLYGGAATSARLQVWLVWFPSGRGRHDVPVVAAMPCVWGGKRSRLARDLDLCGLRQPP